MKFGLIVRAYAPFVTFGIPLHHGDNRGPTTSSKVTSRLKAWVVFDPSAGTVEVPNGKSDETSAIWGLYRDTEIPNVRIDSVQLGKSWIHFRLNGAAANPLWKPASPDIDVHAAVTVSIEKGRLNLNGELTGDQFPNFEVILQDTAQGRRMVMTYETTGNRLTGPETDLWRDKKRYMNSICRSFAIDEHGHFL